MPDAPRLYRRYFKHKDAIDFLDAEVQADLRIVGEKYMTMLRELRSLQGRHLASWDWFPSTIDNVEERADDIHVSGSWTRRGCTDAEYCDIPKDLVYADPAGRSIYFAGLQRQIDEATVAKKTREDAAKRAQIDKLKAELGEV